MQLMKSDKLKDVRYDIRGPILAAARRLEEEGFRVAKLNIGDPAPWGFEAPEEIVQDVIANLSQGRATASRRGCPPPARR